jgi:hypothetical protein
MTGLRIKILNSKGPSVGLRIRIKRLITRLSNWFSQLAENDGPSAAKPEKKIRVIRSTRTPGANASSANAAPPARPTTPLEPAAQTQTGGITVNLGERRCTSCGDRLFDGSQLIECSRYSQHKIHRRCASLAGHKCPECQAALN